MTKSIIYSKFHLKSLMTSFLKKFKINYEEVKLLIIKIFLRMTLNYVYIFDLPRLNFKATLKTSMLL